MHDAKPDQAPARRRTRRRKRRPRGRPDPARRLTRTATPKAIAASWAAPRPQPARAAPQPPRASAIHAPSHMSKTRTMTRIADSVNGIATMLRRTNASISSAVGGAATSGDWASQAVSCGGHLVGQRLRIVADDDADDDHADRRRDRRLEKHRPSGNHSRGRAVRTRLPRQAGEPAHPDDRRGEKRQIDDCRRTGDERRRRPTPRRAPRPAAESALQPSPAMAIGKSAQREKREGEERAADRREEQQRRGDAGADPTRMICTIRCPAFRAVRGRSRRRPAVPQPGRSASLALYLIT